MSEKRDFSFHVEVPLSVSIFGVPWARRETLLLKAIEFTEEEAAAIKVELDAFKARAVREFGQEAAALMTFPTAEDIAKLVVFFGFTVDDALKTAGGALDALCEVQKAAQERVRDKKT